MKSRQEIKRASKKMTRSVVLTMLFALMIFCILFLTIIIIGGIMIFFLNMGILFEEYNNAETFTLLVIIFAVASLIVGTLISLAVSHIPLRPVLEIMDGLNRLEQGDYKTRINLGKFPLFLGVSDNFNKLASELEHTEMLRTDFINNFSHEFKTPIVSIRGFARLLQKEENLSEAQKKEYLGIIEEEASRLTNMATNVLNLTKVENQDILTGISEFNLSEQIRNCVLLTEKKWSDKNIEMILDFDEFDISGNEEMLKQVWINLLDNAIKFSPDDESIIIKITDNDERITVSIENHGPKIKKEDMPMIMNKFFQGDRSHSVEGNGIGLAIVDRVIKLHDGSVCCESTDERTIFFVGLHKSLV